LPRSVSRVAAPRREWEDLARLDPLWAILTDNRKQFGKWDLEEFFASGRAEIAELMKSCGFCPGDNGRVLDFGCGVGRLSRALRDYFGSVYGVDISDQMVKLAREHTSGCEFLVNQTDDLKLFQDNFFEFVYSNIVLQHQPSGEVAGAYIKEFVRTIKPGGMVVFQMPYRQTLRYAVQPRRRLYSLLRSCGVSPEFIYGKLHLNPMRGICLSPEKVAAIVSSAGGRILRSYSDTFNRHSLTYMVAKS